MALREHPDKESWSIHALRSDIQFGLELDQTEIAFIAFLRSQDPDYGYNMRRGGWGGGEVAEEGRRKVSAARKAYFANPENRQKQSEAMQGNTNGVGNLGRRHSRHTYTHSADTRRNISEALRGKPLSAEHRRKLSKAKMGKTGAKRSEETKRRMREAWKTRRKRLQR
jgi:hypothetical protein